MCLVILLPLESVLAQNQFLDVPGDQFEKAAEDLAADITGPPSPEDIIGEDIIINVDQYQPKVIPTALIEDQGATIIALLEGQPTNPTIDIESIDRVITRPLKITTTPPNKAVSLGPIQHVRPQGELSYDNMGHLIIPIRRIPREADVPEQIDIDMVSRIYFKVSSGLTVGPEEHVLVAQPYEQWLQQKEKYGFYAGYLHAEEITPTTATITAYDRNLNKLATVSVSEGGASSIVNAYKPGFNSFGKVFDKFKLRVKDIHARDDKVTVYVTREGKTNLRVLSKGQKIDPHSDWTIAEINILPDKREVVLRNKEGQTSFLSFLFGNPQTTLTQTPAQPDQKNLQQTITAIEKKVQECINQEKLINDLETCYATTVVEIEKIVKGSPSLSPVTKNKLATLLMMMEDAFEQAKQHQDPTLLTQYLEKVQEVLIETASPSTTTNLQNPHEIIQSAQQSYQQIIDEYPESKNIVDAKFRKGWIQWHYEKNLQGAIATFKNILDEHSEQEINQAESFIDGNQLRTFIALLSKQQPQSYTTTIKDLKEKDESITTITLLDVEDIPLDLEATARIQIGATELTLRKKDPLQTSGIEGMVVGIKDQEVEITYKKNGQDHTALLLLNKQQELTLDENKKVQLKLLSTNLQREAHIIVEPAVERAFSDAYFTLHLPIEKRPFGLPLFSESIDGEIADTEELLAKLDKIIGQATAIHETWAKMCYLTYGTLWVKNLLFGGQAAIARKKVNDIYYEKWENNELQCKQLTFEQCITQNYGDEYEKDLDFMDKVIDETDSNQYKEFSGLGNEYDDDQKDLYVLKRLREQHPDDERIAQQYFAQLKNLQVREVDLKTETLFRQEGKLKDFSNFNQEDAKKIQGVMDSIPEFHNQVTTQGNDYSKVYNSNKEAIFKEYKNREKNVQMNAFFSQLTDQKKTPKGTPIYDKDLPAIHLLKQEFDMVRATGAQLPQRALWKENDNYHFFTSEGARINIPESEEGKIDFTKESFEVVGADGVEYTFTKKQVESPHKRQATLVETGRSKGKVEFLTIDALYYLQVEYSESGKIERTQVYKRGEPNDPVGTNEDIRVGEFDDVIEQQKKINPPFSQKLSSAQSCITSINKKAGLERGDKDAVQCADGMYSIGAAVKPRGSSCIDFMSPSDCRLMFNACDPVICPTSRCNLGGNWQVEDQGISSVAQTGIIGSTVLCAPNFPEVIMPVCITGIVSGLQNLRSIIAGYRECLIVSKVEGRSVGICDKIRSFGVCEILWKEGIAIMNIKEGLIGAIGKKIFSAPEGGGEYSAFQQSFDNSMDTMKFFTQEYAKNIFAQYNGGSLPEIGATICKSAIFGKAPGIGTFFDQITRPESPPQFTATLDETPFTDITNKPQSIYNLFYHIYAGENQDIRYSIYLQTKDFTGSQVMPPLYLIRSRPLPREQFASESVSVQRPSGYQEVCVEISSQAYGKDVQCGFGKVSTSYFLHYVNDEFTQSELRKDIDSEEECVPETGRITTYGYQGDDLKGGLYSYPTQNTPGGQVIGGVVGSFSSGLLNTGIVRKCSQFDPDVGTPADNWKPIGDCGKDERGREIGTCWLHTPSVANLVSNKADLQEVQGDIEMKAKEIVEETDIPGVNVLKQEEIQGLMVQADQHRKQQTEQGYKEAIAAYNQILNSLYLDETTIAQVLYERGRTYEELAFSLLKATIIAPPASSTPPSTPSPPPVCPPTNKIPSELGTPDKDKIYTVELPSATPLYFRQKQDGTWEWSPDKQYWMPTSTTVVSGGKWDKQQPVQGNIDIIKELQVQAPCPPPIPGQQQGAVLKLTFPSDKVHLENIGNTMAKNVVLSIGIKTLQERWWIIPDVEKKTQIRSIPLGDINPGEFKEEEYEIRNELLVGATKYKVVFEYLADNIQNQTLETDWKVPSEQTHISPQNTQKEFKWEFDGKQYSFMLNLNQDLYKKYKNKEHFESLAMFAKMLPTMILDPDDDVLIKELATKLDLLAEKYAQDDRNNNGEMYDGGIKTLEGAKIEFISAFVPGIILYNEEKSKGQCDNEIRFPVELLSERLGVCSDVSVLAAHIFYSLGYDVGFYILYLEGPDHIGIGINTDKFSEKELNFLINVLEHNEFIEYRNNKYIFIDVTPSGSNAGFAFVGLNFNKARTEGRGFIPLSHK